jgi:tyrosyl-tRNA synthetase
MTLQEAMSIWEGVFDRSIDRMDPRFLESLRLFGKTVSCNETDLVSDVFIKAGLCSSKGDFKRSMNGLKLDEKPVVRDEPIGGRKLLRKGKHDFVVVI